MFFFNEQYYVIFFLFLLIFIILNIIKLCHPILIIFFLIIIYFMVSIFFITLGFYFIGYMLILIYVGALSILFSFVLMIIPIDELVLFTFESKKIFFTNFFYKFFNLLLIFFFVIFFLFILLNFIGNTFFNEQSVLLNSVWVNIFFSSDVNFFFNLQKISFFLFEYFGLIILMIAFILFVSLTGPIHLLCLYDFNFFYPLNTHKINVLDYPEEVVKLNLNLNYNYNIFFYPELILYTYFLNSNPLTITDKKFYWKLKFKFFNSCFAIQKFEMLNIFSKNSIWGKLLNYIQIFIIGEFSFFLLNFGYLNNFMCKLPFYHKKLAWLVINEKYLSEDFEFSILKPKFSKAVVYFKNKVFIFQKEISYFFKNKNFAKLLTRQKKTSSSNKNNFYYYLRKSKKQIPKKIYWTAPPGYVYYWPPWDGEPDPLSLEESIETHLEFLVFYKSFEAEGGTFRYFFFKRLRVYASWNNLLNFKYFLFFKNQINYIFKKRILIMKLHKNIDDFLAYDRYC